MIAIFLLQMKSSKKVLMNVKDKKATGIDRIPAELKNQSEYLPNFLYETITKSYETRDIPIYNL